jgi:DNA-binding XRE family transcriptional regulator
MFGERCASPTPHTFERSWSFSTMGALSKHRPVYVAALVLRAFVGERPEGYEIRFINGNKRDCRLENLSYVPRSENRRRGEAHPNSGLTAAQVAEIRRRYSEDGAMQQKLANEFGVGRRTIRQIVSGKTWKHVDGPIGLRSAAAKN